MENLTTIKDRLLYLIRTDFNNNKSALAKKMGTSRQYMDTIINKESVGKLTLEKLQKLGYNPYWILTGGGEQKLNSEPIINNNENGTLFDNENIQNNSSGALSLINTPEFKQIPFYPMPLNSGAIFDISLIGVFNMRTTKNYDNNTIIAFQNANKELPERFISKNATIVVDTSIIPIGNDVIVAVKNNELILDVYSSVTQYDKIIGKVIEAQNLF
jgi:hypothetical protein